MEANRTKLYGKWGENIYFILDKSIADSFEGRLISLEWEVKFNKNNVHNYSFPENVKNTIAGIIDIKYLKKEEYQQLITSMLIGSLQMYKSKNLANPLNALHTSLSLAPANIQLLILLSIAYMRV